jgi:hypothetical protein
MYKLNEIDIKNCTLYEWQRTIKPENELIVQASTLDGSDGITNVSIGMCFPYVHQKGNNVECQIGSHDELVLCSVRENTDMFRRKNSEINRRTIIKELLKNNVQNIELDNNEYYKRLPNYKFIISPEGNGIDCHRHYESLLAGCIPIIEYNKLIVRKYGNVPILYTYDYTDVNSENLNDIYEQMLYTKYDFSKLLLSYQSKEETQLIKIRGNAWCEKLANKKWYI